MWPTRRSISLRCHSVTLPRMETDLHLRGLLWEGMAFNTLVVIFSVTLQHSTLRE